MPKTARTFRHPALVFYALRQRGVEHGTAIRHIASQLQCMGRHENRIASLSRADPELRAAAESVLKDGQGLSSLINDSVRRQIDYGKIQAEFIARGLPGLAEAERYPSHDSDRHRARRPSPPRRDYH
jgi:hypothetical protein